MAMTESQTPSRGEPAPRTRVGVLALQGAFREHVDMLRRLGVEAVPVRLPGQVRA